jgi:hypothetical protein
MAKVKPLSEGALKALEILKSEGSMTLAEMKEKGFDKVNSSHLTALKNRGLVSTESVEKEVTTIAKRTVNVYSAVVAETEEEESAE